MNFSTLLIDDSSLQSVQLPSEQLTGRTLSSGESLSVGGEEGRDVGGYGRGAVVVGVKKGMENIHTYFGGVGL